jgi:hypothetical protein
MKLFLRFGWIQVARQAAPLTRKNAAARNLGRKRAAGRAFGPNFTHFPLDPLISVNQRQEIRPCASRNKDI